MKTLAEKLTFIMEKRSVNQHELAELSRVSQVTIHKLTSGKSLSSRKLPQIAKALKINTDWLINENEPMEKPTLQYNLLYLSDIENEERTLNIEPLEDRTGQIPLISWVSAGSWCEAIDSYFIGDTEKWLPCPESCSANTYALRVNGDSMTSVVPGSKSYPDGCIVYVDPLVQVTNGRSVIAKLPNSNEATFKIYKEDAGEKWLMPINTQYEKILINEDIRICGVVIAKYEPE